jgi:hypothetical protein
MYPYDIFPFFIKIRISYVVSMLIIYFRNCDYTESEIARRTGLTSITSY